MTTREIFPVIEVTGLKTRKMKAAMKSLASVYDKRGCVHYLKYTLFLLPAGEFIKGDALIVSQEDALSEDLGKPLLHSN